MTEIEQNRAFMERFVDFINTADHFKGAELIAEDAQFFVPGQSEPLRGVEGYMSVLGMMRAGFPDIQWTLEETVIEGDRIAARFTMRGTHLGSFFRVPATSRPIEVRAINLYRLERGKIVEETGQPDMLGLLHQIGTMA